MAGGIFTIKRRVWIGLGCTLFITVAWWVWNRAWTPVLVAEVQRPQAFVRLAGAGRSATDQFLRERADLFDPTPLFFPTDWNFGQRPLPESMRRQPGQVFGSFGANFTFGEQNIRVYGSEVTPVPEQLPDVLVQGNEAPFAGMGQIDVQRPALVERAGFLEVVKVDDGKIVMSKILTGFVVPSLDFVPMEFLIVVSSSGIVGELVQMPGSILGEVDEKADAFFRSYLVKTFRLGERLNPGRYRVVVGP
jgi:hypothetical protein